MDFDFNEEQYMFRETVRSYLSESFTISDVRRLVDDEGTVPELWKGLSELGLFGILVPEEQGGMGLGFVDLALVFEECGRALVPSPVAETIIATDTIVRFGSDEQKKKFLPAIAEGNITIIPAISEANGYGAESMQTTASRSGNAWTLNGAKILVPQAKNANYLMVAARFEDDDAIGLVMIEPDRDGVSVRQQNTLDPSLRLFEVKMEHVSISHEDVVGGEPDNDAYERIFDASGAVAAILMSGISGKVLDDSVEYSKQREQFGKPIGSFQAIKHKCADMAVAVDAGRSAAYFAAWSLAENAPERIKAVSMAKSFCGDAARFACNESIQIHGGIGFTWELGLHFYLRRAKFLEYVFGDANFHRERVIASTLAEIGGEG